MKDLVYILVGILIGGWLYSKFLVKKDQPLPDVSIYENRIDSLQKEIEKDKSKLTTTIQSLKHKKERLHDWKDD